MNCKQIGLFMCVALVSFPCVGISDNEDSEQQLTSLEQFKQCLVKGFSWEQCVSKSGDKLKEQTPLEMPVATADEEERG